MERLKHCQANALEITLIDTGSYTVIFVFPPLKGGPSFYYYLTSDELDTWTSLHDHHLSVKACVDDLEFMCQIYQSSPNLPMESIWLLLKQHLGKENQTTGVDDFTLED